MKRRDFETLQKTVKLILENDSRARNSDDYLYSAVCRQLSPDCANAPFCTVISDREMWDIPSYESVCRTRRKLQEKYPELDSFYRTKRNRSVMEKEYRKYARS